MNMHQRIFTLVGGSLLLGGCPEPGIDITTETSSGGAEDTAPTIDEPTTTGGTSGTPETTIVTTHSTTADDPTVGPTGDTTTDDMTSGTTGGTTSDTTGDETTSGTTTDDVSGGSSTTGDPDTGSSDDTTGEPDSSSGGQVGFCGDGEQGPGEQCDAGGQSAECDADCSLAECGDGQLNAQASEVCDDGNTLGGDACTPLCQPNPKVEQLALGALHSCVRLADGDVRCFGYNASGQLGYNHDLSLGGLPEHMPTPKVLVGGAVIRLDAHSNSNCAVLDTGRVRCWGAGGFGVLGYGDQKSLGNQPGEMPTPDLDLGTPVKDISVGGLFACALTQADNVRCWGYNSHGELGQGHKNHLGDQPGELPVPDLDLGGPVDQVTAGGDNACAILKDGTLRCWGSNFYGELGYGDTNHRGDEPGEMPPPPVDVGGEVAQVTMSDNFNFTCALLKSGSVRCWGENKYYALGNGVNNGSPIGDQPGEMPPPEVPLAGKAVAISASALSVCALLESGDVQCWGSSDFGALGVPGAHNLAVPTTVDVGGPVAQIASGNSHRCALLVDGKLRCWGSAKFGRLGTGSEEDIGDDETPASAPPIAY